MRLLIVDDDRKIVEMIRETIDWKELGISEIFCAYHIEGAKPIIGKGVDIVISDIEMPGGSGLELIRWARENGAGCEFIFLTCHDSFDFIREAMKLEAASYVLKPVEYEELIGETVKVIERIQRRASMNAYGELWLKNRSFVQRRFWQELILSDMPPEQGVLAIKIENRSIDVDKKDLVQMALIRAIETDEANGSHGSAMMDYQICELAAAIILNDSQRIDRVVPYERSGRRYYACLAVDVDGADIQKRCEEFVERYKAQFSGAVTCYIGEPVHIVSLSRQRAALEEMGWNDYRRGVIVQNEKKEAQNRSASALLDVSCIQEMLNLGDKLSLMRNMREQMEFLLVEGKLNLGAMCAIQQSVMQEVVQYLRRREMEPDFLFADVSYCYLQSKSTASTYDMIKWMNYSFSQIIDMGSARKKQSSSVDAARAYIHMHFAEDITREEVARHVCLAPEYFAKQFKKEYGTTIKDYINMCRANAARDLLKTTDLSITEIAGRVGFSDSSYFTVVFKKIMGASPSEFRQKR